jgi:hypothetical protein
MPDKRKHRGPHPEDRLLFADAYLPTLRAAAADLTWLLDRGYAFAAASKLVGDRFQLRSRQRAAIARVVCPDAMAAQREARRVDASALGGAELRLDGFNVLTTVEAALGGAVILKGRDGCYRDLIGVHGNYRQIAETVPAIGTIGKYLARYGVGRCIWYLDRPVSNSGRLGALIGDVGREQSWDWSVELAFNPDAELRKPGSIVATADGGILDAPVAWVNLVRSVVDESVEQAWIISVSSQP